MARCACQYPPPDLGCRVISTRGSTGCGRSAPARRRAPPSWPRSRTAPATFDLLRHPLLPYQRDGMLHLAFGERALLADEMGLGKTIQAIAACELLARRKGIERVLVVCPASLKAEWEEQIARFADRPARSCSVRAAGAPSRLPRARLLHHRQLRAGARRRRGHQRDTACPTSSCSTRRSASRTGRPRPRGGSSRCARPTPSC